jgi:hypothetical protein
VGKFALLIGVSESNEEDLPALPSAIKDIKAMQAVLQNPELGGFDSVKILQNPIRQEMEEAIEILFVNCNKEDLVLFYFSGHGITDEKGKLYLVTPQTRKERGNLIKATAVAATVLHDNMGNSRSKRQVLILDSCFSGAIAEGLTGKSAESKVDIQKELGGEGRAILTSSNAVQKSFHIKGYDLSIYTHHLLDGIQTGAASQSENDYISVDELHEYVKKRLEEEFPSMSPQFFPVKEGYKINLVCSLKTKGDSEREYRKKDEQQSLSAVINSSPQSIQLEVDYSRLECFLKEGTWEEANEETAHQMLRAMGRDDWWSIELMAKFPSTHLKIIDDFWVLYSQGKFGFSIQKRVYIECGGIPNGRTPDPKVWQEFSECIGWKFGDIELHYNDLTFDLSKPQGHLPIIGGSIWKEFRHWGQRFVVSLLSHPDIEPRY